MTVSIKIIASPDKVRLLVDDNVAHEGDIIPYDVLFTHFQKHVPNVNWHYEWTADIKQWDKDNLDTFQFTADEDATAIISIGEPLGNNDEEECEHLHVEDYGAGANPRLECMDCGAEGTMYFDEE